MAKSLIYSALFGSGLLVGALLAHQPWALPASAASGATRFDCVGFDSDDNGEAIVTILNTTNKSFGGTLKWYNEDGDQVSDDVDFDIEGRGSFRESTSKKGVVHAAIKADGAILVDGRLTSDKMTVAVKCSAHVD